MKLALLSFGAVMISALISSPAEAAFTTLNHEASFKMVSHTVDIGDESIVFSFELTEPLRPPGTPPGGPEGNLLSIQIVPYDEYDRHLKVHSVVYAEYDPAVTPLGAPLHFGFKDDFTGLGPIIGYVPFTQPGPTSYVFTIASSLITPDANGDIYYQAYITHDGALTDSFDGTTFVVPLPPIAWVGLGSLGALFCFRQRLSVVLSNPFADECVKGDHPALSQPFEF